MSRNDDIWGDDDDFLNVHTPPLPGANLMANVSAKSGGGDVDWGDDEDFLNVHTPPLPGANLMPNVSAKSGGGDVDWGDDDDFLNVHTPPLPGANLMPNVSAEHDKPRIGEWSKEELLAFCTTPLTRGRMPPTQPSGFAPISKWDVRRDPLTRTRVRGLQPIPTRPTNELRTRLALDHTSDISVVNLYNLRKIRRICNTIPIAYSFRGRFPFALFVVVQKLGDDRLRVDDGSERWDVDMSLGFKQKYQHMMEIGTAIAIRNFDILGYEPPRIFLTDLVVAAIAHLQTGDGRVELHCFNNVDHDSVLVKEFVKLENDIATHIMHRKKTTTGSPYFKDKEEEEIDDVQGRLRRVLDLHETRATREAKMDALKPKRKTKNQLRQERDYREIEEALKPQGQGIFLNPNRKK